MGTGKNSNIKTRLKEESLPNEKRVRLFFAKAMALVLILLFETALFLKNAGSVSVFFLFWYRMFATLILVHLVP